MSSSDDMLGRSILLCTVQSFGVVLAMSCAMVIGRGYCEIAREFLTKIEHMLFVLICFTYVVAVFNKDVGSWFWQGVIGGREGHRFSKLSLSWTMKAYAVADLTVIAGLLYCTGGPRNSLFTGFLFIVVPVTIILRESWGPVLLYTLYTAIIFGVTLFARNERFEITEERPYNVAFGIVTGICFLFPAIVYILTEHRLSSQLRTGEVMEEPKAEGAASAPK